MTASRAFASALLLLAIFVSPVAACHGLPVLGGLQKQALCRELYLCKRSEVVAVRDGLSQPEG